MKREAILRAGLLGKFAPIRVKTGPVFIRAIRAIRGLESGPTNVHRRFRTLHPLAATILGGSWRISRMLSFFISIPIIAAAVFFTTMTARLMWRLKAGWIWWGAVCLLVCVGAYAGCRLGCSEIQTSPTFRWAGLPLPIGFFVLEGDHWTDFIPPPPIQWTNFLADILAPVLVLVIPFFVVWRRRDKINQ